MVENQVFSIYKYYNKVRKKYLLFVVLITILMLVNTFSISNFTGKAFLKVMYPRKSYSSSIASILSLTRKNWSSASTCKQASKTKFTAFLAHARTINNFSEIKASSIAQTCQNCVTTFKTIDQIANIFPNFSSFPIKIAYSDSLAKLHQVSIWVSRTNLASSFLKSKFSAGSLFLTHTCRPVVYISPFSLFIYLVLDLSVLT